MVVCTPCSCLYRSTGCVSWSVSQRKLTRGLRAANQTLCMVLSDILWAFEGNALQEKAPLASFPWIMADH
jgi:hypothetical protein